MAIYDLTKQQVVNYLADFEEKLPNLGMAMYQNSPDFSPTSLSRMTTEATRIIRFMGVNGFVVLITYDHILEKGAAGMAHYNDLADGFFHITIDPRILHDKQKTMRIMAHELCHLYLKHKGIHTGFEGIDEASAELCTIYMGLGLLTLRGYEESTGYLNLEDFCHAFCVVYRSRGMSDEEIIRIMPETCSHYARNILHDMTELQTVSMKELVVGSQFSDYNFRRRVKILQLLLDNIPEVREKHKMQDGMFRNRQRKLADGNHPIQELLLRETIVENNLSDNRLDKCCEKMDRLIDFMCSTMKIDLDAVSDGLTKNITCPSCGCVSEKKRADGMVVFKCSNCHHMFAWDGSPVSLQMHTKKPEVKESFWNRLLHFGKRMDEG